MMDERIESDVERKENRRQERKERKEKKRSG